MAAVPVARRALQPDRAPRSSAALRTRNDRQPLPAVPGRQAPAVALLQRRHGDGIRAGPVPADGGTGLLLQQQQVSLPVRFPRYGTGETHSGDVVPSRSGPDRCLQRAGRDSGGHAVHLRVEVDFERLYFAWRVETGAWIRLPGPLDASILSDEAAAPGTPNFTGAFVGVCCQDLAGTLRPADFDYFVYRERGYRVEPFDEDPGLP